MASDWKGAYKYNLVDRCSVPGATIVSVVHLCVCPYVCKWDMIEGYMCVALFYEKCHSFTNPRGLVQYQGVLGGK